MNEIKIFDINNSPSTTGTGLAGYLNNVTYQELVDALGLPTFNEPSGDDKTQVEWVLDFNGNVFTIYDWKTYDREYTENKLTRWNIGSIVDATAFIAVIEGVVNEKR